MPWDASRVVMPRRRRRGRRRQSRRSAATRSPRASRGSRPTARSSRSSPTPTGGPRCGSPIADGTNARPVLAEQREHAEPAWGPGQRSYAWSPDGAELAWCRNEDGLRPARDRARRASESARELSRGWHRGLDWGAGGIACVRSGAVTPPQVVVLAANGSGRRAIARGPVGGFEATGLVEPQPVKWKSGSATVHGLLWRRPAQSATARRPAAARARARRADRPGARRLERRACSAFVQRGLGGAAARLPRLDGLRPSRTRRRSPGAGASATSPTSRPASATR